MEFPQGESMGSIYLSNLDVTQSNLGGSRESSGSRLGAMGAMGSSRSHVGSGGSAPIPDRA
jgi:hypothetical protein